MSIGQQTDAFVPLAQLPRMVETPKHGAMWGQRQSLQSLFEPSAIAVVGATDRTGSVGLALLQNLRQFGGKIYPVNPRRSEILGHTCFPSLNKLPMLPDLAVVAVPAPEVRSVVKECAELEIPAAIVISAGFLEGGVEGARLEEAVRQAARGRVRLLGPNCLGMILPHRGLNASFALGMPKAGPIAFLSQSGALCAAMLDWSLDKGVGFSAVVSVGGMTDVNWADLIEHFGEDERTGSIACYMESIGDARGFLAAATRVNPSKPIVVLKVGRTAAGARAAISHTGRMTGEDDVMSAALERSGVLRVHTMAEFFDVTEILAKRSRPPGPRLAILTNAGGPGALAADETLIAGASLAQFSPATKEALGQTLPPRSTTANPVDLLGTATSDDYGKAASVLLQDSEVDCLLAILTPQAMTEPDECAARLVDAAKNSEKPILACWMGETSVQSARKILNAAAIPTFRHPDGAAHAFGLVWRARLGAELALADLSAPSEATAENARIPEVFKTRARQIIDSALLEKRALLTELEANGILRAFGVPVLETSLASSESEAVECARHIGFPVAVKLSSAVLTHKAAAGGVRLNVHNEDQVRDAWQTIRENSQRFSADRAFDGVVVQRMVPSPIAEVIVGTACDPMVGPVVLFGSGGALAEALGDRALAIPPLSRSRAARLIDHTALGRALRKLGELRAAVSELEGIVTSIARIAEEFVCIREIEINPLALTEKGWLALDARVVLALPSERRVPVSLARGENA